MTLWRRDVIQLTVLVIGVVPAYEGFTPTSTTGKCSPSPIDIKNVTLRNWSNFSYWVIILKSHYGFITRKKAPKYHEAPPKVSDLNEAKVLINELWEQLRHYEAKPTTSSKNHSKSPSSDSPKDRHERKKMKALVVAIREELKNATQGINENSHL